MTRWQQSEAPRGDDYDARWRMQAAATSKAPELSWIEADLAELGSAVPGPFDVVVLAGNVMIFLEPGTEARTLAALAGRLTAGGLLVAGFSMRADRLTLERYDGLAVATGLQLAARWATWDHEPFEGGDYAVSVHKLASVGGVR